MAKHGEKGWVSMRCRNRWNDSGYMMYKLIHLLQILIPFSTSFYAAHPNKPKRNKYHELLNPEKIDPSGQITLSRVLSQRLQEDGAGDEIGLARERPRRCQGRP